MADDIKDLSQEEMIALANQVNSQSDDPTVTAEENDARKAAAAVGKQDGSKTADELAAEAAAFKGSDDPDASKVFGDEDKDEDKDDQSSDDADDADDAEDAADDNSDDAPVEFPKSDDPGLNAALNLMKAGGMSADDVQAHFGEAIATGDVSRVDVKALEEKLGKDNATLVLAGVTKWSADAGAEALEAARQAHEAVGGSENWAKMTAWAKQAVKGDKSLRAEIEGITDMLNGNATARKLGAQEFKRLYEADSKNSSLEGAAVREGDAPAKETIKPMTGIEAYQAKEKLNRQRQLGKVTHAEFQAGMAKIQRARNAAR